MRGFPMSHRRVLPALLGGLVASTACGGDTGPRTGALIVGNTVQTAAPVGVDSFAVTIDGKTQTPRIRVNQGGLWLLPPGTYSVGLTGLPSNCATVTDNGASTGPNPQPAAITASDTTLAWFAVACQ